MIVLANTMAMTARERIGEYAILKTLGFRSWYLFGLIVGESLLISLAGGLVGMAAVFPAARLVGKSLEMYFPIFAVTPQTLLLALGASVVVGFVAALIPVYRAVRIRIADGLRGID
jgi:putative ABC transport system permease protein